MRVLDLSLVAAVFLVVVDFGCCQMDGTEKCGGLVKQFCTPCEKDILEADQPTFCSEVSLMCQRQFCNPMCLKEAWDIDVSCEGAFKGCADVDDSVKDAMVAMFNGWGCVDALECCEDDSRLHEWYVQPCQRALLHDSFARSFCAARTLFADSLVPFADRTTHQLTLQGSR